jgi:hypothetical protein
MRRKPIPTPIARPSDVGLGPRPLAPARATSMLPTVAALLAVAAIGCDRQSDAIKRDETTTMVTIVRTHQVDEPVTEGIAVKSTTPRKHDPTQPLPALGMIEEPPPPPPPVTPPPVPTTHPYPVKGGMKAVHPVPTPPPMPGGIGMVKPTPAPTTVAPTKKPPKLGGDVAPTMPETT